MVSLLYKFLQISFQRNHLWSGAFSWKWDHIFSGDSCTYCNQSKDKDPFRPFSRDQSVHKIILSKAKNISTSSTVTRISKKKMTFIRDGVVIVFALLLPSKSLMLIKPFFQYSRKEFLLIREHYWWKKSIEKCGQWLSVQKEYPN